MRTRPSLRVHIAHLTVRILLAGAGLCGCTAALSVGEPLAPPPQSPASAEVGAPVANGEGIDTSGPQEPFGDVSLRDALALALAGNPSLAGASWKVEAGEAREIQAGLFPNPELEGEVEDFGGSGPFRDFERSETTLSLSQLVELGGKRARRVRAAELETSVAGWDREARRLMVLTETKRAFVAVLASQKRLELARRSLGVAERVLASARARVEAGKSSPLEEGRARVLLSRSQLGVERSERDLVAARTRLASRWGSTVAHFGRAVGELESIEPVPPLEALVECVQAHPQVARWASEVSARQARVDLARAEAIPDIRVRGGLKLLEGSDDTAAVVGLSLPLPIFDRNPGRIRAARAERAHAAEERRATELEVQGRLASSHAALRSAHAEVTALRDEILPETRAALEAVMEAFEAGKSGYLEVLDAERTLFDLREQYIRALSTYHGSLAEVEGLIGRSLADLRDADSDPDQKPEGAQS